MKLKVLFCLLVVGSYSFAQSSIGLSKKTNCSHDGVILFAPLFSTETFLIDKCGREVHRWKSNYTPGQSVYLLPNGNLLRAGNDSSKYFMNRGGVIEILDWNSKVLWSYSISDSMQKQHHDVYPMPNGNILAIVWEKIPGKEALNLGRDSSIKSKWIWSDKIVELKPLANNKAQVVWQWRAWDHLVQEFNPALPNYGIVADNPQLININFLASTDPDWLHFNSLDFNPELNQILISNRNFSEVFIIDHSTTMSEASTHQGGRLNKGGDLIFRWGNPSAYNHALGDEQQFYRQHNAHWIKKGLSDAGKIMVFNNGTGRPDEFYSTIDIINPVIEKNGSYKMLPNHGYLPDSPEWQYGIEQKKHFHSINVSGAQRLLNGNTLICDGEHGRFFEVDKNEEIVWSYVNPVSYNKILSKNSFIERNEVFRCTLYERSYKGLRRKSLKGLSTLEKDPVINNCTMEGKVEPCR